MVLHTETPKMEMSLLSCVLNCSGPYFLFFSVYGTCSFQNEDYVNPNSMATYTTLPEEHSFNPISLV